MVRFQKRELLQHVRCPECGVPMIERQGSKGGFYGCSRFPLCIGTRPKGGEDDDSYTKLLHKTYVRAVRFISSPRFMGYVEAPRWMAEQAIGHAPTIDEFVDFDAKAMANEHLERAIDSACAWASEKAGDTIDFLLNEHEERYASLRAKLIFVTTAEQIRKMPKAEIFRRYDMTDLSQFEAQIAGNFKTEGMYCPRCNSWSESNLTKPLADAEMEALFNDEEPHIHKQSWECGRCGVFTKTTTRVRKSSSEDIEFANDANDPTFIKGITFRVPPRKEKPRLG